MWGGTRQRQVRVGSRPDGDGGHMWDPTTDEQGQGNVPPPPRCGCPLVVVLAAAVAAAGVVGLTYSLLYSVPSRSTAAGFRGESLRNFFHGNSRHDGTPPPLPPACASELGVPVSARLARPAGGAARVVAIGDVHGDRMNFYRALRAARLVDPQHRWSAGRDILVLTGDLVERGADTKSVLEAALRLTSEAHAAGGAVIQLLGNHEIMTLRGRMKYVNDKDVRSFGGAASRARAFSANGLWGKRLRCLPAVVMVEGDLFVHAGLLAKWANRGLDALNADVRKALLSDSFRAPVLGTEGPLWTRLFSRKYAPGQEDTPCSALRDALRRVGANRMIVGHTVQHGAIKQRCSGQLIMIDTGLSYKYDANPSALVVRGLRNETMAVYPNVVTDEDGHDAETAAQWVDMSRANEVQAFLKESWARRDANKRYWRKKRWLLQKNKNRKLLLPRP